MYGVYIFLYKSSLTFDHYYFTTDGSLCLLYSIHSNATITKQTNKQTNEQTNKQTNTLLSPDTIQGVKTSNKYIEIDDSS